MASRQAKAYVRTHNIKQAVRGQEQRILAALGVRWPQDGKPHIDCPYPNHGGETDWRWDDRKGRAFCTCSQGDNILNVIEKCEGVAFEDAKIRAAEIVGRQ